MKSLSVLIALLLASPILALPAPATPAGGPLFVVSPSSICFGHVVLGTEKRISVVVSNPGSTTLSVSSTFTDNAAFAVSPGSAQVEPGGSATFEVAFAPVAYGCQGGVAIFAHDGPNTMDAVVLEGGGAACIHPVYQEGWNMVSLPTREGCCSVCMLYPGASSCVYDFHTSYHRDTTLIEGRGYWVKFDEPTTVHYMGFPSTRETVSVSDGWNIVGSITTPAAVANITSMPPGIGASTFYSYDGTYHEVDILEPGHAYWVKLDQGGEIVLNAEPLADMASAIRVARTGELPPPAPGLAPGAAPYLPQRFGIFQNYPNPFNPVTTIGYDLPFDTEVSVAVYNVLGERVALLASGHQTAGHRSVTFEATNLPSGMYTCRLMAGDVTNAIRMVLLR